MIDSRQTRTIFGAAVAAAIAVIITEAFVKPAIFGKVTR